MELKELKEKFEITTSEYSNTKAKHRNTILNLIKKILEKYNGVVDFSEDGFWEELSYSIGTPTVTYDGGNHPEYASNAFSQVNGAKLENDEIYIDCEDCLEYSTDRIWCVEELEAIADAFIAFDEFKEENK